MAATAERASPEFTSPVSTSLEELIHLRSWALAGGSRPVPRPSAEQRGGHVSRRLGRGLDFAEVRAYTPGDDVRLIDWKVTARSGLTHTKLFNEERERPVQLVIDYRAGMRFATEGMFKSVMAARLAALVGWQVLERGDRIGGQVFADDWHRELRPRLGRRSLLRLFEAVAAAQRTVPAPVPGGFAAMLRRLRHGARTGSEIWLFSDFQGFDETARLLLGTLSRRLGLVAVHVVDQLDRELPEARGLMVAGMQSEYAQGYWLDISAAARAEHAARFRARAEALESLFTAHGSRYVRIDTRLPFLDAAARLRAS